METCLDRKVVAARPKWWYDREWEYLTVLGNIYLSRACITNNWNSKGKENCGVMGSDAFERHGRRGIGLEAWYRVGICDREHWAMEKETTLDAATGFCWCRPPGWDMDKI